MRKFKYEMNESPFYYFYFLAAADFLVPLNFFSRFFFSLRCFEEPFLTSASPFRTSLYFGSNFLIAEGN